MCINKLNEGSEHLNAQARLYQVITKKKQTFDPPVHFKENICF